MKNKKILSLAIAFLVLCVSVLPTNAASTQEKITDAKNEQQAAESKLEEKKQEIKDLQAEKGNLEDYLKNLNTQLSDLATNIEELQEQAKTKEIDLERIQGSLVRAKALEEKQYEDMKLRIQYMYENSNWSYIEMLLTAESFSDFLNKADAIAKISEYDREMLDDYSATRTVITEQEKQAQEDKKAIESLKQQQEAKQIEVQNLIQTTDQKIQTYMAKISDAESTASTYISKIQENKKNIENLMERSRIEKEEKAKQDAELKKAQEQAKKNNQGQNSSSTNKTEEIKQDNTSTPAEDKIESSNGSEVYLGKFKLTAYCWCAKCNGRAGHPTASGTTPVAGRTVAMAGVPFGTKLKINGTIYTVEDRGTSYGHVDVFHNSHAEALSFGLQYADVYQVN